MLQKGDKMRRGGTRTSCSFEQDEVQEVSLFLSNFTPYPKRLMSAVGFNMKGQNPLPLEVDFLPRAFCGRS